MIIGTAGHIDHGKTSLVRALTGVDTDRLPEEQRRGITIELGFAPLVLPGVGTVGVVDVPGHEAFVRTMVAGATGIDLGLLVVAADEGVMPQTREHLAILRLLDVRAGVVAITKADLVDPEWLALVTDDIRDSLKGSSLETAPVAATSVKSGAGLDELRSLLADTLARVPPRSHDDLFRLPIDRVFTVKGTGTVVTGTSWSGQLSADTAVVLEPGRRPVRVRGIQQHGTSVDHALPGARVAVALAGLEVGDIRRGSMLLSNAPWTASDRLHAEVWLENGATAFRPREWLRLHLGTTEVSCRVVVVKSEESGSYLARLVTDTPIVARGGDRFVLRRSQPIATVAGGIVLDPSPALRKSRPSLGARATPAERLRALVAGSGGGGLEQGAVPVRLGTSPAESNRLITADETLVSSDGRVFLARDLDLASQRIAEEVDRYIHINPLESGVPLAALRTALADRVALFELALHALTAQGRLEIASGLARQPGWVPKLSKDLEALLERVLAAIDGAKREPPTAAELAVTLNAGKPEAVAGILRYAEREGRVVAVEADRWFSAKVVGEMVSEVQQVVREGGGVPATPAMFRERLGVSRKYLMPFLEYCDHRRITERRGEGRVLP